MGTDLLSRIFCNYFKKLSFPLGGSGMLRTVENLTDGGVHGMIVDIIPFNGSNGNMFNHIACKFVTNIKIYTSQCEAQEC